MFPDGDCRRFQWASHVLRRRRMELVFCKLQVGQADLDYSVGRDCIESTGTQIGKVSTVVGIR